MIVQHLRSSHEVGGALIYDYVINSCSRVTTTICVALVKGSHKKVVSFNKIPKCQALWVRHRVAPHLCYVCIEIANNHDRLWLRKPRQEIFQLSQASLILLSVSMTGQIHPNNGQVGLSSELNLGATKPAISRIGNPHYREFLTPQYCSTTVTPGQLRVHIQSWVWHSMIVNLIRDQLKLLQLEGLQPMLLKNNNTASNVNEMGKVCTLLLNPLQFQLAMFLADLH